MRGFVKLFLFFLFALSVFSLDYYLTQQYVPQYQVQLALSQMNGDHQDAANQRVGLWLLSFDNVTLLVAASVFFVGVVSFWDEIVAMVTWLVSSSKEKELKNG